jgi:hypothetical protein
MNPTPRPPYVPRVGRFSAYEVTGPISFIAAAGGQTSDGLPPLGIFDRQRVLIWLKAMEAAFAPIAEWLP